MGTLRRELSCGQLPVESGEVERLSAAIAADSRILDGLLTHPDDEPAVADCLAQSRAGLVVGVEALRVVFATFRRRHGARHGRMRTVDEHLAQAGDLGF